MLLFHVFDFYGQQGTEFQRFCERHTRLFRVYVHLDDLLVIDHNNAVAEGFEEQAQLVRLGGALRVAADDELRAVGEVDLAVKFRRNACKELGGLLGLFGFGHVGFDDLTVLEDLHHAIEDHAETLTAGIDDACFFQNGEKIRCGGQCFRRAHADGIPNINGVVVDLGCRSAFFRRHAGNGQNGAFGRLHNGFISGIHADGERRCELCTVCFYGVLETLREAAEQKGKDNAGVASCAAQHGGSRRLCDLSGCFVIRKRLHGVAACTDRHGHIRARVAVRNGEDVEVIHKFPVFQYAVRAGDDCVAKLFTCNHCIHILSKNVRKAKSRLPIDICMYFQTTLYHSLREKTRVIPHRNHV